VSACSCPDPWTNHPNGFKWDATSKVAIPAHFPDDVGGEQTIDTIKETVRRFADTLTSVASTVPGVAAAAVGILTRVTGAVNEAANYLQGELERLEDALDDFAAEK
jgi:hypothetical protein